MKNLASSLLLCGALGILGAQTNSTSANTSTDASSPGQTISGLLMDASCAVISGNRVASGHGTSAVSSNNAVRNSSTSTSAVTHSGRSSPTEGIRNNSASTQGTTGTADTTGNTAGRTGNDRNATTMSSQGTTTPADMTRTAGARAADERNRTGDTTSGASTVAGSTRTHSTHDEHVSAGGTGSTGATSGANSASALGTTGAATHTTTATAAGTRTRSSVTTVREKYAECIPTATTTSFALHANGELYILDDASNDMVRQQMSGEAFRGAMVNRSGQPQWMTVSVVGTPGTGNTLTITSVRK